MKIDPALHAAVNAALDDEATRWGRENVEPKYGADVARVVQKLWDQAVGHGGNWSDPRAMDNGMAAVSRQMKRDYPWLSTAAFSSLVQAFAQTWK